MDPSDLVQRKQPLSKPRLVKARKSASMKARPPSAVSSEKIEEKLFGWNPFLPEPRVSGTGANLSRTSSRNSSESGSFGFGNDGVFVFGNAAKLSRDSSIGSEEGVFVFGSSVDESLEKMERMNIRDVSAGSGDFASASVFEFGNSFKESSEKMERLNIGNGDNASGASAAVGGFVFGSGMNDSLEKMVRLNIRSGDNLSGASATVGGFVFGSGMNDSLEKMERLNIGKMPVGSTDNATGASAVSNMKDSLEKMERLNIRDNVSGASAAAGMSAFGSTAKRNPDTGRPSVPHSDFTETKENKEEIGVANTLHDNFEKLKIDRETEKPVSAMPFKFMFGVGKQDRMGNQGGSETPHVELRMPEQGSSRLTKETFGKEQVDAVNSSAYGTDKNITGSFGGNAVNTVHEDMAKLKIGSKVDSFVDSTPLKFSFGAGDQDQSSSTGHIPPFKAKAPVGAQFTFNSQPGGLEAPHMEFETAKHDSFQSTKDNLFSVQHENIAFSVKRGQVRSTKSKKKITRKPVSWHNSFSNQFAPAGVLEENPETGPTNDYSPMDCSPYPEETVAESYSREASVATDDTRRSISVEREEELVSAAKKLDINELNDKNQGEHDDNGSKDHAQRCSTAASSFEGEHIFGYGKESDVPKYEHVGFGCDTRTAPMEMETGSFGSNIEGQASSVETGFIFSSSVEDYSQPNFSFSLPTFVKGPLSDQKRNPRRKSKGKPGPNSYLSTPNSSVPFASPSPNIFPPTITSMPPVSDLKQKDTSFVSQNENGRKVERNIEPEPSQESKNITASIVAAEEACEKWRHRGNQAYANANSLKAEDYYTRGIESITVKETTNSCIRPLTLCYSNRAATRMSLGRMREAIGDCKMALAIDPNFLRAQVRLANCHLSLGEIGEALKAFKKCLQAKDVNSNPKIITDASDGLEKAQKVADLTGQCAELLLNRTANDASKAFHIISVALLISPLSESLMEMKAEALLMMRKYEEVIQCCEGTLDLAEKNSVVPEADSRLKDVVSSELKGSSARLWRWQLISKSYFYLGKLEEALELLQKHETEKSAADKYGNISSDSSASLAVTIHELLRLKAAGNEAFQAARHSEAVECYTAALMCNTESRPFSAVCFCNRAAAYQALGQIADAIADCSLAIALDPSYPKAISRRVTLHEIIRDYGQAANDLQRLISLLEKRSEEKDNQSGSGVSGRSIGNSSDLKKARKRLATVEEEARKGRSLDMYMILGVEPSSSAADIKKAYRKAALRHHPDKAGQFLVRNENVDDGLWREVANEVHADADRLFKMIGESYTILSDPTKRLQYDEEEEMRTNPKKGYSGHSTPRTPADSYSSMYERNINRRQWRAHGSSYQRF